MTGTLTNPSLEAAPAVRLRITGGLRPTEVLGRVLTHEAMNAANTFARPDEVHPVGLGASVSGHAVQLTLPRKSVAVLRIQLA